MAAYRSILNVPLVIDLALPVFGLMPVKVSARHVVCNKGLYGNGARVRDGAAARNPGVVHGRRTASVDVVGDRRG